MHESFFFQLPLNGHRTTDTTANRSNAKTVQMYEWKHYSWMIHWTYEMMKEVWYFVYSAV